MTYIDNRSYTKTLSKLEFDIPLTLITNSLTLSGLGADYCSRRRSTASPVADARCDEQRRNDIQRRVLGRTTDETSQVDRATETASTGQSHAQPLDDSGVHGAAGEGGRRSRRRRGGRGCRRCRCSGSRRETRVRSSDQRLPESVQIRHSGLSGSATLPERDQVFRGSGSTPAEIITSDPVKRSKVYNTPYTFRFTDKKRWYTFRMI